jgi:hypothetical protein
MLMLLPNYMHEFTRVQYSSPENKQKYSELLPRIQKVTGGELDLELTLAGIRRGFITVCSPDRYEAYKADIQSKGLYAIIIGKTAISGNSSYGAADTYREGDPYMYRVAVCRTKEDQQRWLDRLDLSIDAETIDRWMGELLGYPQCCIDNFITNWVTNNSIDPTFDQSKYTTGMEIENRNVSNPEDKNETITETWHISMPPTTPFEASTMLRWVGVRLVPHLPCSWECEHSIQMAKEVYEFRHQSMYKEEIETIYEMLQWPVEWSVMHGIAEIYTPCFRVFTRGDCTIDKYVVQKQSDYFPLNGSRGNRFPFKTKKNKVSESKSFKLSLVDYSEWEENGYTSKEFMEASHDLMIEAATSILISKGSVLDLGCGNGIFVEKLHKKINTMHNDEFATMPCGLEIDETRIKSAMDRIYYGKVWWADMFAKDTWDTENYSLITFMPGRILEQSSERIEEIKWLVETLPEKTEYLLVYLTTEWKEKYSIQEVMEQCGMSSHWAPSSEVFTNELVSTQLFKKV